MSAAAERRLALALAVLARWTGAVDGAAVVAAAIIIDDWISGGGIPSPVAAAEPEPAVAEMELEPVEPEPVAASLLSSMRVSLLSPVVAEPEPESVAAEPASAEVEPEPPALDGLVLAVFQAFHAAVVAGAPPPYNRELVERLTASVTGVGAAISKLRKIDKILVESFGPRRRVAVKINGDWCWSPWSDCEKPAATIVAPAKEISSQVLEDAGKKKPTKKEFLSLNDAAEAAAAFLRTRDFVVAASPEGWLVDGRRHDSLGLLAIANRHLRQMGRPIYVVRGGDVAA